MDKNFNPIKDLQPVDPFNLPAGESTKSIEAIRLRLVETRSRTAGIVDILKKRNKDFSKDIKTIRELNRRLMRTIPRIPILRGDASVQGDSLEEISARRGGFDFDFDTTTVPSDLVKPNANIRNRLINFAIDVFLFYFGGRIFKFLFPGAKNLGNIKNINRMRKRLNEILGLSDEFADVYKVNPGKKIKKIKVENPVKADKNEISKIAKKFFNKNNTQKVTSEIRAEANTISNALASGDKKVLEKASKSILKLEERKADILAEFGKTIKPTKLQTNNHNKLIQEIDKAILKIRNIQGLPQFKSKPLSTNEPLPKTLQEIIAESEDFGIFQYKPRPRKKLINTQRDREINIYQKGKEFTEDVNQFIKLDGNTRVDPKLIEELKRRSGIKKEIYVIDK
tara:strand:- start:1022 stop:2209 length:1188 start_codon:yes stop_codon:yes gene_type:complete